MVGEEVTIAGFAESVRGRGGICFVTLRDGTGKIQAFLKRGSLMTSPSRRYRARPGVHNNVQGKRR